MLMSLQKELRLTFKDHNICLVYRKNVDRGMEGKDTTRMGELEIVKRLHWKLLIYMFGVSFGSV